LIGLFRDPDFQKKLRKRIAAGWTFEKIEPMSTDEIFARLNQLGIEATQENFLEAAQQYESADRLAEKEWYARYTLHPEGRYDGDFAWMAAIVLWKRLIPDRICFEQIDECMQEGYSLLMAGHTTQACDVWWQVWKWVKEKVSPERNTLSTFDDVFQGTQLVFNWCQDFEMELANAGVKDAKYHRLRFRYCREFLETFIGIERSMRKNFLRAEAESHWRLGEIETAEAQFKALIEDDPDWAWGYIGWSDECWLCRDSPKDYDQGEAILQQALKRSSLEDRGDVLDRLKQLREERAQVENKKQPKRRRKRRRKR